jgi:hypothetical protein
LLRGDEHVGEVRRSGILRPRYEATLGYGRWQLQRPRFASSTVVDLEAGTDVARLEEGDERGRLLVVEAPELRPEVDVLRQVRPDGWAYLDPEERVLLTVRSLGGRMGEIAAIEPGERAWPSSDPDAGVALAVAIAGMELVARRDDASARSFDAS